MLNIWRRITNVERELAQLESPLEREAVWWQATRAVGERKRSRVLELVGFVVVLAASALLFTLLEPWLPIRRDVLRLLSILPVVGTASALFVWARRREIQTTVRRLLRERGLRVCMRCGYDLRGNTQPRCPECGRATGDLRPLRDNARS